MNESHQLPANLAKDCTRIGYSALNSWMRENDITLAKSDNFFDSLAKSLHSGALTKDQLNHAIAELDENSDKKIHLLKLRNIEDLAKNKKEILKDLYKRKGIAPSDQKWVNGNATSPNPTFINLFWDNDVMKIKYAELQYDVEFDYDNERTIRHEKKINVVYLVDLNDGLVQIRFDSPGNVHKHKNENGKSSEAAYESDYKSLLSELFPDLILNDLNLNHVANHIAAKELKKFRINKGTTTITNNAKQTFATASIQADVRNLPEYEAAASTGTELWLTEDLKGYWVAKESGNELKRDLFMRISRKFSQIRVQRGCLEKELNYGIKQIREIQGAV